MAEPEQPPGILSLPEHPDPHIIFMQPLRPTCWRENCDKAPTTLMRMHFALTMFVQGLCDEHAKTLTTRLQREGFELLTAEGCGDLLVNIPLRTALTRHMLDGTVRETDIVLPETFPRDWHLHATSVDLVVPPRKTCWVVGCEKEKTTSIVLFSAPKMLGHLADTSHLPKEVLLSGMCSPHSNGVGATLRDHHFSMHPQRSGGMVYRSPRCPFPFGSDPDDGGDEDEVAA